MDFREWLNNSSQEELIQWFQSLSSRVLQSINKSEGFISISIGSLANEPQIAPNVAPIQTPNMSRPMALSASVEHPGAVIDEVTKKGYKGDSAMGALGGDLGWSTKDQNTFSRAMSAGRKSIPMMVGKEMGLLFEVEIFIFLVNQFKLKPVGDKNLAWAVGEQNRLFEVIRGKAGQNLGRLAIEFIQQHASGRQGMASMIYTKAMALIRECVVDSIEFSGGANGSVTARLNSDTADLRIGCEKYMPGVRKDVGFSLKAVTESQVDVRHFTDIKALAVLGGLRTEVSSLRRYNKDPNIEDNERRIALLQILKKAAEENYTNKPKKFAQLLELLVTGGADTIPAYRMLLRADSEPGWSGAINKDFVTGEGPGRKLGAKLGSSPVIEVKTNSTYVQLIYMVQGGNNYGTSVKFQPDPTGKTVSVVVSNLTSKGGRGY